MKKKSFLPITEWSLDDRPREKLIQKGTHALSDAELIAILLGSGSKDESAVALAQRLLLENTNNLNRLARCSISDLKKLKGIGEAKAISIIAALELGKRRRLELALQLPKITGSKDVFELMQPILGDLPHEEFWVIILNNANKVLTKYQLSKGGLTGTLVDVRVIFKKVLELGGTGIILCHNHPSEKLQPSSSDRKITQKIKEAGNVLDINVLDHLIITEKTYFSFADNGDL